MRCSITVLSTDRLLCKTISPGLDDVPFTVGDYDNAFKFQGEEYPINDLDDLADILGIIEERRDFAVIRGGFTPFARKELKARRSIRRIMRHRDDYEPTVEDRSRSWLMIDIDQFELADINDLICDDPRWLIERMISETLPVEFHNRTAFWQWSSTCGYRPNVAKAHIWFWLDQPRSCAELKVWADYLGLSIDSSVYVPSQLHYTAQPRLVGVPDRLPSRSGWLVGEADVVELRMPVIPPAPVYHNATQYVASSDWVAHYLDQVGKPSYHDPLKMAAFAYALLCKHRNSRDDLGMMELMAMNIEANPSCDGRYRDRLRSEYLSQLISSAHNSVCHSSTPN